MAAGEKEEKEQRACTGTVEVEALAYHMRCGPSLHQGAMQAMQIVDWTSLRDAARFASVLPTSPAQPVVSPGCGRSTSSRGSVGGGDDIGPPRCTLSP